MDELIKFFNHYFDAEWATWQAFATEPDIEVYDEQLDAFDELREYGVHPDMVRTPFMEMNNQLKYMNGSEHRRLFALALNPTTGIGSAYVSSIRGGFDSVQQRFIAVRSDGGWKVVAQQFGCRKCHGNDSDCGTCKGKGWDTSIPVDLPKGVGDFTEYQVLTEATADNSAGLWARLASGSTPSPR